MKPDLCKAIVLERLRYFSKTELGLDSLARRMDADVHVSHVADSLILSFMATLAGQNKVEVDVSFPVDWWSAFKDRWFPKWLLKRYPAQMRRIKVDKATAFPSIDVPGHTPVVIMTKQEYDFMRGGDE